MLTRSPAFTSGSFQRRAGVQHAGLVLRDGDDHHLRGCDDRGSTNPWLSLWVMMIAPIRRVDAPQLVWNGYCNVLSRPVNVTS